MQNSTRQANPAERRVTAFICANSARAGRSPTSSERPCPDVPDFSWAYPVEQVIVPCAGRLQPEHVLKVFETGMDAVCVVACEDDNCHTLEGSRRCERRLEYVRGLLEQVGVGSERLLFFRLPGSAREDQALGMAATAPTGLAEPAEAAPSTTPKLRSIRDQLMVRVRSLPPSPLRAAEMPAPPAWSPGR
jgi:coenzyme F420-reducing hydrogenase delta subunit